MLVAFSSIVYIVIAAAGTFVHKAQFKGYAGHHLSRFYSTRTTDELSREKLRHAKACLATIML